MAPPTTRKPVTKPTTPSAPATAFTFQVDESEGIKRAPRGVTKHEAYPQVQAAVARSLTEKKAFKFAGLDSEDAVKQAKNMLAQARAAHVAKGEPIKISQSVETHPNGTYTLHFQAVPGSRKYRYTADDIRKWWAMQPDGGELTGKIPTHVRDAYKQAHGLVKTSK